MYECPMCKGHGITLGAALYGGDLCSVCNGEGKVNRVLKEIEVFPVADNGFSNPLYIVVGAYTDQLESLSEPMDLFQAEQLAYRLERESPWIHHYKLKGAAPIPANQVSYPIPF